MEPEFIAEKCFSVVERRGNVHTISGLPWQGGQPCVVHVTSIPASFVIRHGHPLKIPGVVLSEQPIQSEYVHFAHTHHAIDAFSLQHQKQTLHHVLDCGAD